MIIAAPTSTFDGVSGEQLHILRRMGVLVSDGRDGPELPATELVVDALIGYSLQGAPTGVAANLIRAANAHGAPILSLDAPSGVDATTGRAYDPAVRATATLTLALPKTGLYVQAARSYVGELYLADIGVPPALYADHSIGLTVGPIFAENDILRLY